MSLRKICKCCGKKKEEQYLRPIGFAHNNGRIWICKDQLKCNSDEWQYTIDFHNKRMVQNSPTLSEIEKRTQEHREKLFASMGKRW